MNVTLRRQVLDSAKALFMANGYEKVGMREIARSIGLNPMQIYRLNLSKTDILAEIILELNAEQIRLQAQLCANVTGDTVFERVCGYLLELYRLDITYLPIRSVGAAYGWMWNDYYEAKITAQIFDLVAPVVTYLSEANLDEIPARCYAIWSLYYVGYRHAVINAGTAEGCLAEIKPSLQLLIPC